MLRGYPDGYDAWGKRGAAAAGSPCSADCAARTAPALGIRMNCGYGQDSNLVALYFIIQQGVKPAILD